MCCDVCKTFLFSHLGGFGILFNALAVFFGSSGGKIVKCGSDYTCIHIKVHIHLASFQIFEEDFTVMQLISRCFSKYTCYRKI
ncbi:unknown [Bacteroides sp. CAG:927]|nr:unknown [Bacteroides sp. CAG:927]